MISSRRLAREWALKILYQSDVGKMALAESRAAALERLRQEFVQRGSRVASGSSLEEVCLDVISKHLSDVLPDLNTRLEAGIHEIIGQFFAQSPFWRNLYLDYSFSRQSFIALLDTPRLSRDLEFPSAACVLPDSVQRNTALSETERRRLQRFASWAREGLPQAALRAFTAEVVAGRPEGAGMKVTLEYVQEHWRGFTLSMAERWANVGQVVQKQIGDWLKVASFTVKLVEGVDAHRETLDKSLHELSTGWALDRQVSVDRNILRIAGFEMVFVSGIPASASINEAVELAKKYSTAESGRFVNGILGTLHALQEAGAAEERARIEVIEEETLDMEDIPDREELEQP